MTLACPRSFQVCETKIILRLSITFPCGFSQPLNACCWILLCAGTLKVHNSQVALRYGIAKLGRLLIE